MPGFSRVFSRRLRWAVVLLACLVLGWPVSAAPPPPPGDPSDALPAPDAGSSPAIFGDWLLGLLGQSENRATAKFYRAVELAASDPRDKARAALAQAEAFWRAGRWWAAYEAYRHVTTNYASLVPFDEVLERQFYLAREHFEGNQGRFLWFKLSSNAKAIEIYDHLLKVAPYSTAGTKALYRSALCEVAEKNYERASDRFNRLLTTYPESALSPLARADLAATLLRAAKDFDGDGTLSRQARTELDRFIAKYPEHPRANEAMENLRQAREQDAARLLFLGQFYQRPVHLKEDASRRYLEACIRDFPETTSATRAAELLAAAGHELPADLPRPALRPPAAGPTDPAQAEKWLLPLEDLKAPGEAKP